MATAKKEITYKEVLELFKETANRFKETDRRFKKLEKLFGGQWSRLVESLVEGDLIKLLKNRKISVDKTMSRIRAGKESKYDYEFDILAVNGKEIVAVEVKTTLDTDDVKYFIEKLNLFKKIFPEYSDKTILGAIAYLREDSHSAKYADRQGLLVIRATGSSASITNKKTFKPKSFG